MSRINEVSVIPFHFEVADLGLGEHAAMGVSNLQYEKGAKLRVMRYAVRIRTDDGLSGGYVTHWVGTQGALGQTLMLAPHLLGRDPEHREQIYDDFKRELRAYDGMGHGPLDIALWDLVGRKYGIAVATMLGAYKTRLPTYASTHHGQDAPGGLDSPRPSARTPSPAPTAASTASRSTAGTTATCGARPPRCARCGAPSATAWRSCTTPAASCAPTWTR